MTKQKSKRGRRISDDTKKSICDFTKELINKGEYRSLKQISDKFFTTTETVRQLLIKNDITIPTSREAVIEAALAANTAYPVLDPTVATDKEVQPSGTFEVINDFNEITVQKVIKAVTCSERHNQPYGAKPIFGSSVDSNLMFDFEKLNEIADNFITENIKFVNGVAVDALEVIVTGLTMLSTAVIAAAAKRNVSLTLLHYDRETKTYKKQVITSNESSVVNPVISVLKETKDLRKIYAYKDTDVFSIKENDKVYIVKQAFFSSNNNFTPMAVEYYITTTFEDSFELYSKILRKTKEIKKEGKVIVTYMERKVMGDKIYFDKSFTPDLVHTYSAI